MNVASIRYFQMNYRFGFRITSTGTFKANKFRTSFFYGGELEFANMKAYLVQGQFDEMVSVENFESKDLNSKWGAHDGVVANRLQKHLQQTKPPFFCTWLTLSSHEPFEIPVAPIFDGDEDEPEFLSSIHYTDEVLYQFIQQAKTQPWWANTLVVITGDHGHRIPAAAHKWEDFHTPLLLLGGALQIKGIRKSGVGSQTDIAATILAQYNIPASSFVYSRNMLAPTYQPFAYFSFNNGFGWVDADAQIIYDNVGMQVNDKSGNISGQLLLTAKKMQQAAYQDYLNK
jgi:phosphoglycerol transferase MdoB-like AlkP superfamily enzyme